MRLENVRASAQQRPSRLYCIAFEDCGRAQTFLLATLSTRAHIHEHSVATSTRRYLRLRKCLHNRTDSSATDYWENEREKSHRRWTSTDCHRHRTCVLQRLHFLSHRNLAATVVFPSRQPNRPGKHCYAADPATQRRCVYCITHCSQRRRRRHRRRRRPVQICARWCRWASIAKSPLD